MSTDPEAAPNEGDVVKGHGHGDGHGHTQDNSEAGKHMNRHSFQDLVKRFEDPERLTTWKETENIQQAFPELKGKVVADVGCGS
eukprot:CAMPEP_0174333242 /NCGR_PEP_ID=MMETSP0810-20121108/18996_1 /TAXON_ID=73025 ORGANISM="Eutreptiella gymnastica-like, Strain CCMP1594" /NCGR_SAMPLE_ID=MMETSP0810 /ASSEMBLY_ACC=CAM_ASM_000659 /LENGTH=83 /DNA_ID=CAMNT_0015450243 /DNA_START=16 /DNA_END=264 /DNA_ORIENTATION=+